MAKKPKLSQKVKKWDELSVPYCLYCLKQLEGKQKYNKNKFCSVEHRDAYKIISNKINGSNHNVDRPCEKEGCSNNLNEHQFKYCSPKCRKEDKAANSKERPQCASDGCKKTIPRGNTKFCSMECRDVERARKAAEDRDIYWIKVACRNCGKVHEKTRAQADKFKNKFCSQLCYIEWQHTDSAEAGSRFMWQAAKNPKHSKKGTMEHFDAAVRNFLVLKDSDPDIVSWTLPVVERQLGPGFGFKPTVILEFADGHKEAVEITPPGESISQRNSYRWQMIQFYIKEIDPQIDKCINVSTEEIEQQIKELL